MLRQSETTRTRAGQFSLTNNYRVCGAELEQSAEDEIEWRNVESGTGR